MSDRLYPENEAALVAALRETAEPLQIMGGGTRPIGNIAPAKILSTSRLQGITSLRTWRYDVSGQIGHNYRRD
jgi:hypothetical protein